ncbi:hypothetical protein GOODEAATRI_021506 [Goodea atripinnis]|uniref:Uncharacterized protein n=1 Tax=Goodea atripinnis TaxID=208336 RepID=A0ABV0Q023_9TELE
MITHNLKLTNFTENYGDMTSTVLLMLSDGAVVMKFQRKFNLEDSPPLPAPSNYSTTFSAPTNQLLIHIPLQSIIPPGFALKDFHTQNLLCLVRRRKSEAWRLHKLAP